MKKRFLTLAIIIVLLVSVLAMPALAASYPLIYMDTWESTPTIPEGEAGYLKFNIFPEYKNEYYYIYIYDSDGNLRGSASNSMYNTSTAMRTLTINIDTAKLDLEPDTYTVKYHMEFYTYYEWHSAPNEYTGTFKVIPNICHGNHDLELDEVVSESECNYQGTARYFCNDCNYYEYQTLPYAHKYDEGTVTINPTSTTEGEIMYTCTLCGDTKYETLPTSCAAKITTQPKSVTVDNGKSAKVTVKATGDGLTYTWYKKDPGASKFSKTSVTKSSYSVTMTDARSGRKVYCVVADKYGNEVKSNTVTLSQKEYAEITTQPKSTRVASGEKATVTVKATGDGLTYKWYYKDKGASKFSYTSTFTGNSYSVKMSSARDGRQVYCKITDKYGNTVKTNTVTLSMGNVAKIATQPKSVTVGKGDTAKVTVKATGDGLTYKWYVKNVGESKFTYSKSVTGNSYSVTMSASRDGRQVYCKITDKYGNSVKTNTVTLSMGNVAKITTQPESVTVAEGKKATVTVSATGDGLTYKWYYKNPGSSKFSYTSSFTGNSYSVTMSEARSGRQVYCVITDRYGNSVTTETVTLKMK